LETLEVAYILLRFPYLTETFVADEIVEARRQGLRVRIFSLLPPKKEPVHPVSQELTNDVQYAPALTSWTLWRAQFYFLWHSPLLYFHLLGRLAMQPYRRDVAALYFRRLVIFFKSVSIAYDLKSSDTALIHSHFAWLSGAAAMVASELTGIPFTVTAHAYDIYTSNDLLPVVARSAARVITISRYNREKILELCPDLVPAAIEVIHCGIDLDLFLQTNGNHTGGQPLRILSVGSLIGKKGHAYLIQACKELQQRGLKYSCTIIGKGSDEEHLQQLIRDLGVEERVALAGARRRDEVLEAYRRSSVFVLAAVVTSDGDRDGIPVALMEAMAMGLPVISTPVSGIPELVRDEETGRLVPERDPVALAEAIISIAEEDSRRQFGANARTLVEQEFDLHANVRHLIQVFRDCAKV
jgi:colanic acid/amylovoran biosynthesis glycosyltransferase